MTDKINNILIINIPIIIIIIFVDQIINSIIVIAVIRTIKKTSTLSFAVNVLFTIAVLEKILKRVSILKYIAVGLP